MKKILSILGTIGLTATSTTNLVACNKPEPNNNSENGGNKPEPTPEPIKPPENSNWKLVENNLIKRDTGWYIVIHKDSNLWKIEKINSSQKYGTRFFSDIVYKWELNDEPQIPAINSNTGEITDWKEQKD